MPFFDYKLSDQKYTASVTVYFLMKHCRHVYLASAFFFLTGITSQQLGYSIDRYDILQVKVNNSGTVSVGVAKFKPQNLPAETINGSMNEKSERSNRSLSHWSI